MSAGSNPEDRGFDDSPYEEEPSYDEGGFDDEAIEQTDTYEESTGFDDEPVARDPYAQASRPVVPTFSSVGPYDIAGAREERKEMRRRIRGSAFGRFLGFLFIVLLTIGPIGGVVLFLFSQKRAPSGEIEGRRIETEDGKVIIVQGGPPQKIVWSDARAGKAQVIGGQGIKVVEASVGKVRARDASSQVVFTGKEYLRVSIEIESFREAPYEYVSFYGRSMELFDGPDRVRLYDASDVELPQHVFADVRDLEGHTPKATLDTRQKVRDSLYFELPEGKSAKDLGELRLAIPYEGIKSAARYGFRIPSSMIVKEDDSAAEPGAPLSEEDLKALTAEEEEMDDSP